MDVLCVKDDLFGGMQAVERIVATRSTLPIIGNVLFETKKDGIKLSANNLEMGLEVTIPASIKEDGSVLIPAKTLAGIVAKLPATNINIKKTDKGAVKISYKQSTSTINGMSAEEFPLLPRIKDAKTITVSPKTFTDMVKQTAFSVSTSEDKYILNGVLLETGKNPQEKDDSNIRMVATDGFRLAKRGANTGTVLAVSSVIVPAKALLEVCRIIQNRNDEELKISISNEQIAFKFKDVYLVSRLIQGQFPDYKQVLPKSSEVKLTTETRALLEATERAAVIAGSSSNIVKLRIEQGKLHIIANSPDVGSVDEVVDVDLKGEAKSHVAFNVRLITDALKVIDSEKVTLEFAGPISPGIIRPEGDENYIYIIMPIRTTDTPA
ncbi:MAG: DNA polymerase III subunit beta [Candidatus Saganbacteria bacterium]|nr:DNA polymerase III subunit beta [Candidatus Saganbacteria bacterium]